MAPWWMWTLNHFPQPCLETTNKLSFPMQWDCAMSYLIQDRCLVQNKAVWPWLLRTWKVLNCVSVLQESNCNSYKNSMQMKIMPWNSFGKNKTQHDPINQKNPIQSATRCPMTSSALCNSVTSANRTPWAHQTFLPCTMQNCKWALCKNINPKLKHLFKIGDVVDDSISNICRTAYE